MTQVRIATVEDSKSLALLAERTFRETFGAANSPDDLTAHCARSFGESLQAREILDSDYCTLLCDQDGKLAGFGQLRYATPPSCVRTQNPIELHRLYVDKRWHGKGVAQALMTEMLSRANHLGAEEIWLGVWEDNPRAIAFYEKCGFTEIGSQAFMFGDDRQRDLVMIRPLHSLETKA